MTNRSELRTRARRKLEDSGVNPLWDDASLNEFVGDSICRYGIRFPAERSVTLVAATAVTSLPATSVVNPYEIVRVSDPSGALVPRQAAERANGGARLAPNAQAWRWWSQTLLLSRPAALGNWRVDYLGGRIVPSDDVSAVDVIDGDEEMVVLMTVGIALRRRAVEDGKRAQARSAMDLEHAADVYDALARGLIAGRKGRVRGGWLGCV